MIPRSFNGTIGKPSSVASTEVRELHRLEQCLKRHVVVDAVDALKTIQAAASKAGRMKVARSASIILARQAHPADPVEQDDALSEDSCAGSLHGFSKSNLDNGSNAKVARQLQFDD